MRAGLRRFWRPDAGEGLISGLYTLLILALGLFFGVVCLCYGLAGGKAYAAGQEILELMKAENGLDQSLKNRFAALTKRLGLEKLGLSLEGTPKYVQRGDPLELWIKGSYPLSCLRPLGKTWSAPLRIKLTGLAHTYLRGL